MACSQCDRPSRPFRLRFTCPACGTAIPVNLCRHCISHKTHLSLCYCGRSPESEDFQSGDESQVEMHRQPGVQAEDTDVQHAQSLEGSQSLSLPVEPSASGPTPEMQTPPMTDSQSSSGPGDSPASGTATHVRNSKRSVYDASVWRRPQYDNVTPRKGSCAGNYPLKIKPDHDQALGFLSAGAGEWRVEFVGYETKSAVAFNRDGFLHVQCPPHCCGGSMCEGEPVDVHALVLDNNGISKKFKVGSFMYEGCLPVAKPGSGSNSKKRPRS